MREAGILSLAYFMFGIPNETLEEARRSIDFAISLDADFAQFIVLSPYPGTDLYRMALAGGSLGSARANNPFGIEECRPYYASADWNEETLSLIMSEAHRRFYLRPSFLLRNILSTRSLSELSGKAAAAVEVLRWMRRGVG